MNETAIERRIRRYAVKLNADTVQQGAAQAQCKPTDGNLDDTWTHRRYFVDGRLVVTIRHGESRVFRCSPDHPHEWRGVTEIPIGEHVDGCGWHALPASWDVYLAGYNGSPRYCRTAADAYAAADRHVESARRCSLPVRARLCRLLKRHDGPCIPWG